MTTPQFARTWAENTTIQEWIDTQYKAGWATVGDTPPTVHQFDAVLNELDRKAQYLYQVQTGYLSTKKYRPGEICFAPDDDNAPLVGNYYECYRPEGCVGKDPRDPANRHTSSWTSTDPAEPYYWIKLGKRPSLPVIGSVSQHFAQIPPEGYLLLANTQVNATKFYRLALAWPDRVVNGKINIHEARGVVTRGLDKGRGIDHQPNRVPGSHQGDASRKILGTMRTAGSTSFSRMIESNSSSGAFVSSNSPEDVGIPVSAEIMVSSLTSRTSSIKFDSSSVVPTAPENTVANAAVLNITAF